MSIKQSSYSVKGYNLYPSMNWGTDVVPYFFLPGFKSSVPWFRFGVA